MKSSSAAKLTRGLSTLACISAILGIWSAALSPLAKGRVNAATVAGIVRDPAGQALPGVTVLALEETGGVPARTTTDRDGHYQIEGLPEGAYRIDFSLLGFTAVRQNHVRLGENVVGHADAILSVRPLCECFRIDPATRMVPGQVVDSRGRPLPHARLKLDGPNGLAEVAHADAEGRFGFKPPSRDRWSLVASDSGFESMSLDKSAEPPASIVLRLRFATTQAVPQVERFNEDCPCYLHLIPGER